MPSRSSARRAHLQVVPKPHALVTSLFPPLTKDEIATAAERVKLYGQREPIEILDGQVISGWQEYLACVEAKVVPALTEIDEPEELVEYVVRRNVPRHLSKLDRACIAVLAKQEHQRLGRQRMRGGGRAGGLAKGRGTDPRPFDGERWFETAARMVGTTPGAVRRLDHIQTHAPDIFEAVRARRLEVLRDARDIVHRLTEPEARAQALALREREPRMPIARVITEVSRSRRPELPTPRGAKATGQSWTLYSGAMADQADKIPGESIDLLHCDIIYDDVDMAAEVGRIASRVLVPGGVLALVAGLYAPMEILSAVASEGLRPLTVGSLILRDVRHARPGKTDHIERMDLVPVYLFFKGTRLAHPIRHLAFTSEHKETGAHHWQKNLSATLDLVRSVVDPGARVLDPCCGSGTTGEAALRHGCSFIGIDIDKDAIKVASARLAEVERELRQVDGPRPPLVKAARKGTKR